MGAKREPQRRWHRKLAAAATNSFKILAGNSATDAPWPTVSQMLFRLMALAVIEFHDRKDNNGGCFANAGAAPVDAVQFCTDKLANSIAIPDASVTSFQVRTASKWCSRAQSPLWLHLEPNHSKSC